MDTKEKTEKTVWIDTDNRILVFQPFENGNRITKAESSAGTSFLCPEP